MCECVSERNKKIKSEQEKGEKCVDKKTFLRNEITNASHKITAKMNLNNLLRSLLLTGAIYGTRMLILCIMLGISCHSKTRCMLLKRSYRHLL